MKYKTLATFSILLLIVISSVITPPRGYSFLTPNLSIAGIIYWIMKKEFSLHNYHLFILGLLNDLFMGTPLGSSTLSYFFIKGSIFLLQSKIKKNGILFDMLKYFIGLTIYFSFVYIFILVYFDNFPSISYMLMSYLLTLFIFPIIYISFNWIESKMKLS